MLLTCPNGTSSAIFNAYGGGGGLIPGGFGGGGTFLGDALDDGTVNPGIGWEYRWSSVNSNLRDFASELGNTIMAPIENRASMDTNGIYLPEQNFSGFAGCPINGDWTITVQDNLGADNGFIFEWGIEFDDIFTLTSGSYAPQVISSQWLTSASVLPGQPTDTFIVVSSNDPGLQYYTFEVTDNFGCVYDTVVQVNFVALPAISDNGINSVCEGQYQVVGTSSFAGGLWSFSGPGNAVFSPEADEDNPQITVDVGGAYRFTYTDTRCLKDTAMEIYFADSIPEFSLTDISFCDGKEGIIGTAESDVPEAAYSWNTGETSPSITVRDSGKYFMTITGLCNHETDTATVFTFSCEVFTPNVVTPNVVTPNGDGINDFLKFEGLTNSSGTLLKVYDRWGRSVYENTNYQNDWSPIDLVAGTYFYILSPVGDYTGDTARKTFTLLK
jgi:gliding motility-associated-like protein